MDMRRSLLIENLISLIEDNVITFDELNDFSDEIKKNIKKLIER